MFHSYVKAAAFFLFHQKLSILMASPFGKFLADFTLKTSMHRFPLAVTKGGCKSAPGLHQVR